jgi:adenylate cyclase
LERRLAAILAADVVGYTRLMGIDEAGTFRRLTELRETVLEPLIAQHRGRVVKLMGDGLLVEFASLVEAVNCAVAWQAAVVEHEVEQTEDGRLSFRIGVNLGDLIVEGDDIHGDGVNVAARLEGLADRGGICLSGDAYRQVRGKIEQDFEDLGEREVKNLAEPLRVYRIATEDSATHPKANAKSDLTLPDKPSIAVLPFKNMSDDPEQEYFSDGITEDIITDLSKISRLHVASRNSAFVYKGASVKIEQAAVDLRVRFVLEGSVRKAGNNVRISAQLIDGSTGGHVWAERYDRELTNIFQVQDEITSSIVEALKVKISPSEERAIEKQPTTNVDAYQYCLRGRQLLREMTQKSIELAEHMFSNAINLDPRYAQAYAGLADCASVLTNHYDTDPSVLEDAVSNSKRALELDPTLAEVHASHGRILSFRGDQSGAASEFRIAIQLNPNLYEAYWYWGHMALTNGKFEEAVSHIRRALEVGGDDLQSAMMLLGACRGAGQKKDLEDSAHRAFTIAERRLKLNPTDERAHYVGAMALVELGDLSRAREWAKMAAAIESSDPRTNYNLACLFGLLGEVDEAIAYLERSIQEGLPHMKIEWMKQDPDFDSIREEPRFQALLAPYN